MSVPKNYIVSGIGKNFLTPCRRVGLSRSKKTPKNASPLTPVPNILINTPNKNVQENSDVDKKKKFFEERPNRLIPTPIQSKKLINKVDDVLNNTKDNDSPVSCEVTKTKLISNKTSNKLNKKHHTGNPEKKITMNASHNKDITSKILVEDEVHCPIAKRSINFDIADGTCSKGQKVNKSCGAIAEKKNIPCSYQGEENLSENFEENSFKNDTIKNKRPRLRLDSDDFGGTENLPESKNSAKTCVPPKHTINMESCTTLNEYSNSITLNRFTTEEYLKEYSNNPEKFQENLEEDSSAKKVSNRNYVAIICPSINQSANEVKPKRSLSTKKSSLEIKKPLEKVISTTNSKLKQNLMVSIERLTKEDLKSKGMEVNKEIPLEDIPSTSDLIGFATTSMKINILEDDDELFTSSPESDKKQRDSLRQLILTMENEVKQKREKLEKLKQAQVYKKMHSPEKLKMSSAKWLEGCRASLGDLLLKLQENCPMEMDTLTKKLRIPDDILEKL